MTDFTTIKIEKELLERVDDFCVMREHTSTVSNVIYLLKKQMGDKVQ